MGGQYEFDVTSSLKSIVHMFFMYTTFVDIWDAYSRGVT